MIALCKEATREKEGALGALVSTAAAAFQLDVLASAVHFRRNGRPKTGNDGDARARTRTQPGKRHLGPADYDDNDDGDGDDDGDGHLWRAQSTPARHLINQSRGRSG
jgi:hypothetical protein